MEFSELIILLIIGAIYLIFEAFRGWDRRRTRKEMREIEADFFIR